MTRTDLLQELRASMAEHGLAAYLIPNTDPHQSEYIADHWRLMPWLSGFDGSAGTMIITPDFAGVWTDSRYFIQAERQLRGSGFKLMKLNVPHTPEYIGWLVEHLPPGGTVGVDGQLISQSKATDLQKALITGGCSLSDVGDLVGPIWKDRPEIPSKPIQKHALEYSGLSRVNKLEQLRMSMAKHGADFHVLSSLDDIAWLLNIRGADVDYNPVAISHALVGDCDTKLFVDPTKMPESLIKRLHEQSIWVQPYEDFFHALGQIPSEKSVYIDPKRVSVATFKALPEGVRVIMGQNLTIPLKAIKNQVEIDHARRTAVKDGVAMVRLLKWLEEAVPQGGVTELTVDEKLQEFRAEQPDFVGPSFGTIAGYLDHGAIVHYSATPELAHELKPEGMFLLDSGGQYLDGTTDITRTISLGNPTQAEKEDFTLVLKGYIGLDSAIFPAGTKGYQLDILARQHLWSRGRNYGHGTGHGVGFYLNVHEGPQNFSPAANQTAFEVGMITSNEPGLYRNGKYGIRTENLMLCVEHSDTEFGKFLAFETLTLCPIDLNLVNLSLMNEQEIDWLNSYHDEVRTALSLMLNDEEKTWLEEKTRPIERVTR
ncbi:aminopeptidase P family protein [Pontibacter sp. G13]|uniref:aminopeptidase P family protein n=1 Tax=Pontibacter sp. G13 TaxID=3074898 RepID=UPI002889EC70|nr:aminopeptidase P family protein [Pontibacter sp. G13]WNJ17028.1 aminopeptidase P family protein [Pontibacter sp. G13]